MGGSNYEQKSSSIEDGGKSEFLEKMRTQNSIMMSPEVFEKIYLSPQNAVKGDLRKTFANPTPLALIGFLLCLNPLACDLMGWRGSGGNGAASTASYFFFGGVLMLMASVLEFLLGNTFSFVVFGSFGAFWLSYGGSLQPFFNAAGAYAAGDQAKGLADPQFEASFAWFLLFAAVMCFVYSIAAIRTNLVFLGIFVGLVLALSLLAATFWHLSAGNADLASKLQIAGGAFAFVVSMLGWYLFLVQVLASVDFPISLPVGDLSTVVKGASDRAKPVNSKETV